ncbi:MAG: hypothetical protein FWF79_05995 [Defluviitaleaceae bacterium]|nr:hypothetical protein [Defluviitaleaceae bacterium]
MNEKMKILKMLEDGQISAAEAARLLQAVGGGHSPKPAPPVPAPHVPVTSSSHSAYIPPPAPHSSATSRPASNNSNAHSDIAGKFESFARDVGPRVQKFTEVVAEKIVGAADSLSGAFSGESQSSVHGGQQHGRQAGATRSGFSGAFSGGVVEKQIEMPVETGEYNELNLLGLNGEIRVKGYNGDKISARLSFRAKRAKAYIEPVKLGGKYFIKYEPDEFDMVSIDAFVPERAFSVIKIDGVNCIVDAESLAAGEMRFVNCNGNMRLAGIAAGSITAESANGRFIMSNVAAENASAENLNGPMEADEIDIACLKLSNYNGHLSIVMSRFARHTDYIWNVETGNAKLNLNLPSSPEFGYHIKAHAAMGEIRFGLTGLQYLINEPSLVEAQSVRYDTAAKKIKLAVETSNAPLIIS